MVIQHTTWETEAGILKMGSRQLKKAVLLDGLMRYHREVQGAHVFEDHRDGVAEANNWVRQNGLPSRLHSCVSAGPQHISHISASR
jgi:hypothetical protein